MSAVGTGTEFLNFTTEAPSKTSELTVLLWVRRDVDDAYGFGGISDNFSNRVLAASQTASDTLRARHYDNANLGSTTPTLTLDAWFAAAIRWTPETTINSSADARCDLWTLTDGNAGSGFDEQVSATGLTTDTNEAGGLVALAGSLDGDDPTQGAVAMLKVFEAHLTEAEMLTELQYRNPQLSAYASYAFRTGALTTDDSGNGRTLTNQNGATFTADEPSDILGDDPAGGPTGPVAQVITTGV